MLNKQRTQSGPILAVEGKGVKCELRATKNFFVLDRLKQP